MGSRECSCLQAAAARALAASAAFVAASFVLVDALKVGETARFMVPRPAIPLLDSTDIWLVIWPGGREDCCCSLVDGGGEGEGFATMEAGSLPLGMFEWRFLSGNRCESRFTPLIDT